MTETVIEVDRVSKRYRLGVVGSGTLSHDLNRWWAWVRGKEDPLAKVGQGRVESSNESQLPVFLPSDYVWALRKVSFEVKKGEILGIIGRNGAGKSTLLKILSRVTAPTEGEVRIRGRVASLLEVGTGFHPELTGRENIFLNGAILGMTKAEIQRKFDEIVAFAEVEKFIDTPVKRYSSGMYVRLAFAVAAHMEPEILVVDEVLAVGDAEFQKKCLGKMQEVSKGGRTVLFVSHNMPAVARLCRRAVLIEKGELVLDGDAEVVTTRYLNTARNTSAEKSWPRPAEAPGDAVARLKGVRILQEGRVSEAVDIRYPVTFEMEYWNLKPDARLMVAANFFNSEGVLLFLSADFQEAEWRAPRPVGVYLSRCVVPGNFFSEGIIRVLAEVCTREPFWQSHVREEDIVSFNVVDNGEPGSVRSGWGRPMSGVVRPMLDWKTISVKA
jgi:lipopolysaccharide transport system ATP-binding protein